MYYYRSSAWRRDLHSFPTRRSSDLEAPRLAKCDRRARRIVPGCVALDYLQFRKRLPHPQLQRALLEIRSEEHTSELQSRFDLVCRLLLEKKKKSRKSTTSPLNTKQL